MYRSRWLVKTSVQSAKTNSSPTMSKDEPRDSDYEKEADDVADDVKAAEDDKLSQDGDDGDEQAVKNDAADDGSDDNQDGLDDFDGLPPLPPDEDDEFEDDYDEGEVSRPHRERRKRIRDDDLEKEDNEEEEAVAQPEKKHRGRKKMLPPLEMTYLDENGNPLLVERDEIIIPDEDPKAKEKVDENGHLLGGREYRNRVFTVMNLGDQLFMLLTEPARLVGFRDSYLLFKTHPHTLYKKICTNEEKQDLIERGLLPNSYKGRAVNLVTARSIYREFGARMIKDGKKVIDDFWEQRAIDNGDVSGEPADPQELYRKNQYIGGGSFDLPSADVPDLPSYAAPLPTDQTWLYLIASQTSNYNKKLLDDRLVALNHGVKDLYSNLVFYPELTQPLRCSMKRIGPLKDGIVIDTFFVNRDINRKVTGLLDVPKDVYDDVEDSTAIRMQQKFEALQQ